MTLQSLLKIGRLKPHAPTADEIRRLLAAAERNLVDARAEIISHETRFDAAYKAIMQLALIALMASGYRPSTNEPGHHQTMIQSLPLTLGLPNTTWVVVPGRQPSVAIFRRISTTVHSAPAFFHMPSYRPRLGRVSSINLNVRATMLVPAPQQNRDVTPG